MRILKPPLLNYPEDPCRYFNFEEFEGMGNDFLLSNGVYDLSILEAYRGEKIVHIELEEPNWFFVDLVQKSKYQEQFYKILTICPYTAEWLNVYEKKERRIPIFIPFNKQYVPKQRTKKYDVLYAGNIVSDKIAMEVEWLRTFNYRFISNTNHPLVTDRSVTYFEKLHMMAESKITLTHCLLFAKQKHIRNTLRVPGHEGNKAFRNITWRNYLLTYLRKDAVVEVPQIKTRVFEAAFCKSLILHKKDQFNVIERFFKPQEEFLYYDDAKELPALIEKILKNYEDYVPVIERAYTRAMNSYTTEKFFEQFLLPIKL